MRWFPRRRVYVDDLPKTHDARFMVLLLMMFVGVLGGVYVVGYLAAGDKVPARTTVAGVDVGSMTRSEARAVLVRSFGTRLSEPMTVTVGGRVLHLVPRDEGMTFDVDATLDDAMGGTDWNPGHMLKVVEGGGSVQPIFRADLEKLSVALEPLADRVERPAVSTTVMIRAGRPVIAAGHAGQRLDVDLAATTVVTALRDHQAAVSLRLSTVAPAVDEAAATTFVDGTLTPALSRPAVIAVGGQSVTVTPEEFGPALRITPAAGRFQLSILPGALYASTHTLLTSVAGRPVDAKVVFQDGHPSIVPGRSGIHVDPDAWARAVFAAVTRNQTHHATAQVTTVQPGLTTSDARALSITSRISSVESTAPAKLAGALSIAAQSLDGTVILPGASFSYVRTVGTASASTVLTALGRATQTAAERAHLTITRWPDVSPVGHDLGFRNTTDHPVYVHSWAAARGVRTAVFVQFWGTRSP